MATKDISTTANAGTGAYQPNSPFDVRGNTVSFVTTTVGASGADTINVLPLNPGEFVQAAYVKVIGPSNASSTFQLNDSRNAGAILATSAADAAANTIYKAAGADLGAVSLNSGFLTLTSVAAFAMNTGSFQVVAIVGKAF